MPPRICIAARWHCRPPWRSPTGRAASMAVTLIAALAAGYEVGLRVGLAATGKLFMRGHHFQGACGPFVAAATAANLLALAPEPARHALGIAGSFGRRPDGGAGRRDVEAPAFRPRGAGRRHGRRSCGPRLHRHSERAGGVLWRLFEHAVGRARACASHPRARHRVGNPQCRLQALCHRCERAVGAVCHRSR